MRMRIARCLLAAVLITVCVALPAGAFDGNDYGGGGNDGVGWDGGGSDYGGDGSGDDSLVVVVIVVVIAVVVIISTISDKKKNKQGKQSGMVRPGSNEGLHIQLPDRTAQIGGIIRWHDQGFSAGDFISFAKRVYIDIQTAWCMRDLSPVRAFLHENLYDATSKQIQAKIGQGVIYHYESMVVNTAYLTSYAQDSQFEHLTVYLNARMIDWQEDERTGNILRGDKTTRWDLRYKMRFMRSAGVLTRNEIAALTKHSCPNCGAPLEFTSSAQCAFCHSVVTTGQYSWVLADFGTIRNDTVDEGMRTV